MKIIKEREIKTQQKASLQKPYIIHSTNSKTNELLQGYNQEKIDFKCLKHQIQPYIVQLLRRLLPNGRLEGLEYVALNPTRIDNTLGSFRINTKNGKWSDFATGDKGGDVISLYAYLKGLSQLNAAKELLKIVGRSR